MTLEIIGSGLGRTGTKSLHSALNRLGFGPTHHMFEVFQQQERIPLWIEAGSGQADWEAIFEGYRSAVDYPTAAFWRELADYYPDAKVIHTVRDPDSWFDSTQETIFRPGGFAATAMEAGGTMADFFKVVIRDFPGRLNDRAFMTDYFRRHTEAVKAAIAPERLLVYEVREGWGPLCAFLGVAVPDQPFPTQNDRAEFVARVASGPPPGVN